MKIKIKKFPTRDDLKAIKFMKMDNQYSMFPTLRAHGFQIQVREFEEIKKLSEQ